MQCVTFLKSLNSAQSQYEWHPVHKHLSVKCNFETWNGLLCRTHLASYSPLCTASLPLVFFFFSFLIFVCHQLCHRFCPLSISLSWFRPFRDSSLAQGAGLPRLAKDSSPFSHCLPGLLRSRPQGSLQCNWLGIAPHDMSICEKCPSPTCENISPPTTERIGRYHKDKEGESFLAGGVVRRGILWDRMQKWGGCWRGDKRKTGLKRGCKKIYLDWMVNNFPKKKQVSPQIKSKSIGLSRVYGWSAS